MSTLSNSPSQYGSVARAFHWATALLILTLIPLGLVANDMPYDTDASLARKALLFSLHKTLGVAVFFVALARIGWALSQTKPAALHPERRAETFLAELVHWLLYGSLVLVPLSGWLHHAATTGFAPIWWPFGQSLPFVPKDDVLAHRLATLHILSQRVLLLAVVLHVAGALKHHVIDRDATLRRMWSGSPAAAPAAAPAPARLRHHRAAPFGAALGIYAVALGTGAGLGLFEARAQAVAAPAPALAEVASEWRVQDGTLAIAITQFGNRVEGSFADWTAAISFDPAATGPMGQVEVAIATASLTLGSVTDQAMGADFFDAGSFPVATFTADILPDDAGGYLATGTLSLKGSEIPLNLPFTLDIAGDTATMQAGTVLNRQDFGIGASMGDPATLGFEVEVTVALTARRD